MQRSGEERHLAKTVIAPEWRQPIYSLVHLVYLVGLVYLVDLVHLISFVQPNKQDKPNKLG